MDHLLNVTDSPADLRDYTFTHFNLMPNNPYSYPYHTEKPAEMRMGISRM